MNILYLHGLDSKLSAQKRQILEKFGKVYAPEIDYYQDKNAIETVLNLYPDVEINTVIGSSMGGFAGYYVSNAFSRPALLFNPALKKRSVIQSVPPASGASNNLKQIVIGQQDDVVLPADMLDFLSDNFNPVTDLHLHLVPRLGHRIPEPLFEKEVGSFFGKLCY